MSLPYPLKNLRHGIKFDTMIKEDRRFYVYIYLDPFKKGSFIYCDITFENQPFYIGKGTAHRFIKHLGEAKRIIRFNEEYDTKNRKINKIISILKKGKKPIIMIVKDNLTEDEAYEFETELVASFGIKDEGGILYNYESGGKGGYTVSKESREKMSEAAKRRVISKETRLKISISNTGIKRPKTQKQIEKQRKSLKEGYESGKFEPWNKDKRGLYTQTEESNEKRSKAMIGRVYTEEHCSNMSKSFKKQFKNGERKLNEWILDQCGEKNHMFGKIPKWAKVIFELDEEGNILREFTGIKEACIELSLSRPTIKRLCEGKLGYKNKYILKYK